MVPDQPEHRRAGGQELTHGSAALPHRPVDRRAQHRVGQLLPGQCEAGFPLGKQLLAVPDLFLGGLVAALGDQQPGLGRVDLGPGDQILFRESRDAVPVQARLLEHRPRLAHQRGLLGIDALVRAVPGEPQPGAHLTEGGFGLFDAKTEIRRVETGEDLPFPHRAAQVDRDFAHAACDLESRDDLFVGGERPGDGHRPRQRPDLRGDDAHRARPLGFFPPPAPADVVSFPQAATETARRATHRAESERHFLVYTDGFDIFSVYVENPTSGNETEQRKKGGAGRTEAGRPRGGAGGARCSPLAEGSGRAAGLRASARAAALHQFSFCFSAILSK